MGSLGYFLPKNQILSQIIMWLQELFAELNLGKNPKNILSLKRYLTKIQNPED